MPRETIGRRCKRRIRLSTFIAFFLREAVRADFGTVEAAKLVALSKIGALSRLITVDSTNFDESFKTAQTVVWSQAAEAYHQFVDRLLLSNRNSSKLLRQKQDAAARREVLAKDLNDAIVSAKDLKSDPKLVLVRSEIGRIDKEIEMISQELSRGVSHLCRIELSRGRYGR